MSMRTETGRALIESLYATVDARDSQRLAGFLAPDVSFRLGNNPEAKGRDTVVEMNRGFFSSIKGMSHSIDEIWEMPGGAGCTGWVHYERLDGSRLSLPFATILGLRDGLIADYRVYADVSPL